MGERAQAAVEMTAKEPHHAAARPLQRSGAHPGARRMGIGRPSTYASIIDTIQARDYVFKKGGALVPTWVAFAVVAVARRASGRPGRLPVHRPDGRRSGRHQPRRTGARRLSERSSTSATAQPGLKQQLENKVDEIDARDISRIR